MDFPAFIPEAVREHISRLIDGDSSLPGGWAGALDDREKELSETQAQIQEWSRRIGDGQPSEIPESYRVKLESLRKRRSDLERHRDSLSADVDCVRRLAHDERMAGAYALLTSVFTDDRQWTAFIYAAWSARVDFSRFRGQLKVAAELKDKIANGAESLAALLRRFDETGINRPSEFFSIPELLWQTDHHEMLDRNLHMWRSMRRHVLGDPPECDSSGIEPGDGTNGTVTEESANDALCYAWGAAPALAELLDTLARAARDFRPSESGMIGAAIESRQRSQKTEYLRAFRNLLTNVHGFTLTTPIMKAMAIVATVVINHRDVDVTYDDVRKALAKLGGERLKNSGEK